MAQFLSLVLPLAKHDAIKIFSVAPTDILGNFIKHPFKPFFADATIYPFFIFILAPILFKNSKCKFIGLDPIAHSPGRETLATLYFANKGPKTKTPARIVFKR